MKRIKNSLLIIILLLVCSGCTINYNLEINKDTIDEVIEVNDIVMNDRSKEAIYNDYQSWVPVYINIDDETLITDDMNIKIDGIDYHEKEIRELPNGYEYTYKFTYPINKYNDAATLREVFTKRKAFSTNDYLILKTDHINLLCNYPFFESLNINIKVADDSYKLNYTNGTINNNTYSWILNRDNCNNSEIILNLDKVTHKTDNKNDNLKQDNKNSNYTYYIVLGIIIIFIVAGYLIFNKISHDANIMDD